MEIQMGRGIFELGNPEWRGAQAVLEIQVDGVVGGGGGQKTVPSIMGVWILSGITHSGHQIFSWLSRVQNLGQASK